MATKSNGLDIDNAFIIIKETSEDAIEEEHRLIGQIHPQYEKISQTLVTSADSRFFDIIKVLVGKDEIEYYFDITQIFMRQLLNPLSS